MSAPKTERRRVLVVEDSPVTARLIADVLGGTPDLEVAHVAVDGMAALEYLKTNPVDVVTLDVNMPRMGGLETLREILRLHRIPCLMVSSATKAGARTTLDALAAGAVDFFAKPQGESPAALAEVADDLRAKVRAVAAVDLERVLRDRPELLRQPVPSSPTRDLVVIGASMGGPRTLEHILSALPADLPARVVIAQHLPEGFAPELASRLNAATPLTVKVAEPYEGLEPGVVYLAPGGKETTVVAGARGLRLDVTTPGTRRRGLPSVDALFESAARAYAEKTIAVILTGMGEDGAAGMEALHDAGAATLAESRTSAIAEGMPGAAILRGVVRTVVAKDLMAEEILHRMLV
jgi:two-component system chemotaxis response regulator CheB